MTPIETEKPVDVVLDFELMPDIKNRIYEVYAVRQGERGAGGSSRHGFCTAGK